MTLDDERSQTKSKEHLSNTPTRLQMMSDLTDRVTAAIKDWAAPETTAHGDESGEISTEEGTSRWDDDWDNMNIDNEVPRGGELMTKPTG